MLLVVITEFDVGVMFVNVGNDVSKLMFVKVKDATEFPLKLTPDKSIE